MRFQVHPRYLWVVLWFLLVSARTLNAGDGGIDLATQNLEVEHESNGPEGAHGVSMQRMPSAGITGMLITLAGSGALAWFSGKKANSTTPTE